MQTRFLSDHKKHNPKLRLRVARMIDETNFGTDTNPDYGCFSVDELGPDRFVAALLGDLDVLLACCVVRPQRMFLPADGIRSDYISGFCVDPAMQRMGLGRKLHEHLIENAKTRYPNAPHHYFGLDAARHNWQFWSGSLGYILSPTDDDEYEHKAFMRRTW